MSHSYKLLFLGNSGVGKTTFLQRHSSGDFRKDYIPTRGLEIVPLRFYTTSGVVNFETWDITGQDNLSNLDLKFLNQADCAVLMFDVTDQQSYNSMIHWYYLFKSRNITTNIPVALCGNKVDLAGRVVQPANITLHRKLGLQYYDISAKSNYNFEKPFLYLARQLLEDPKLTFTEFPPMIPPCISIG